MPFSSLESVIERNKEGYYLALRQTQGTLHTQRPDFTPWLHFFLNALQSQKIHLEHKVRREKELFYHLPPISARIVSCLLDHGRLGIEDIASLTLINRNTLKKHLSSLTKSNQIARFGKGKATWYTLA